MRHWRGYLENADPNDRRTDGRGRKKKAEPPAPPALEPDDDVLVFGRPLTMLEMVSLGRGPLDALLQKIGPLGRPLAPDDFTARGRLAILRRRGYADAEIETLRPGLLQEVENAAPGE